MRAFGTHTIADFLEDNIVYRSLQPMNPALPDLTVLAERLNLPEGKTPRKAEPAYGQVVAAMLQAARQQSDPGSPIERLIFIGDTRLNDGQAFINICKAGGWPGMAFIGSEDEQEAELRQDPAFELPLYTANRWSLLEAFERECARSNHPIDSCSAVVFDLDKTTLGARGRNDKAIDRARSQAAEDTVRAILGPSFEPDVFLQAYRHFNQVKFHPFTTDNQDYLVYLALLISAGFLDSERLSQQVADGQWESFKAFADSIEDRRAGLPQALRETQSDFYAALQKGDPTPFKAFRRQEYRNTINAMQTAPAVLDEPAALQETIFLTEEVRRFGADCRRKGVLCYGLSDKPDEASLPDADLKAAGWQPLHRTPMLAVMP